MNIFYITPLIIQKLIWLQTRLMLWFFVHLKVNGLENLKEVKTNAIFVCNHSSELDPILVPISLPFFSKFSPMYYATLAQSEYSNSGWRQNFYGGTFFKILGGHQIYIGLKDYSKSLINHLILLRDNKNLCVFPEGGITRDGYIQHAHGGVAYLAEATNKPIIPVSISGVFNMSNAEFFGRHRHVVVTFGKPITQQELRDNVLSKVSHGANVYREEAEYAMSRIKTMLSTI